jgi:ubiquinone biosynthesis protein Coq4
MVVAYLTHSAVVSPTKLGACLERFFQGRRRGLRLAPFFAVKWELMWRVPLAKVRETYVRESPVPQLNTPVSAW